MNRMFFGCSQLIYLNIKNFIENISLSVTSIFSRVSDNIVVCLNENSDKILTQIKNKKCYNVDCSDNYNQKKMIDKSNICWDDNDNNILYKYEFMGIYYEDCNGGILTNSTQIKNCRCNNSICNSCPNLPLNDTFCSECNNGYYQIEKDIYSYNDQYFKCYNNPIGYYLDINESIYKKCFYSCKTCENKGDNNMHNCLECDDNYSYKIKLDNYSNCYEKCNYYHYFDNNNEIHCTSNLSCPNNYPHLILYKNECIVIENNSNKIIDEIESSITFNNNISKSTKIIETENFLKYYEIISIIYKLMNILNNDTIKKTKKQEIEYYDELIKNIEILFTLKYFNTTKLDEGNEEVFETKKMKVKLTTIKNQKNNLNNNITCIDFGECEEELKKIYNLTDNEILYIKKMDIIQEGMRIPKIEYDIYSKLFGDNLIKLNLSICNENNIYLYIPLKNIGNLDQYNKSSDYYNDICSTATSESGTDIIHEDRQKEYINKTLCQDDCDFLNYNDTLQKAICSCKVKESSSSFAYMNMNVKELLNNFKHINNIVNVKILGCVKQLFSKMGIKKNIGSYIMIFIIIIHIIDLFIFFNNQLIKLKEKIKDIIYAVKNIKLIKDNNNKSEDEESKNKGEDKQKEIKCNNDNEFTKDNKQNNKIRPKINNKKKKKKKKRYKTIKNENNEYVNINNNDNIINNNIFNTRNKRDKNINTLPEDISKSENQNIIENVKKTMEYINDELNVLPYNIALQYDVRTFCQYYISLLRIKHTLIFSFHYNNDYNSKIIKIDLFLVGFSIYYAVNALFYNDDTIHNIYVTKGSYGIENQLPKIIYSSIISMALNILLKFLALSNDSILKFKKNKNIKDINERGAALNQTLYIKFIFYFILSFIFLLFFWYYLSMFGAVYINTQFHLLKDTLVSFGLSLFYPFGLCLLPGLFRIPALSDPKKNREYLYKFSKILQIF